MVKMPLLTIEKLNTVIDNLVTGFVEDRLWTLQLIPVNSIAGLVKTADYYITCYCYIFQDIYRHAFSFIGTILHLTHEFPLPKEFFSGAIFTAFYTISMHEGTA